MLKQCRQRTALLEALKKSSNFVAYQDLAAAAGIEKVDPSRQLARRITELRQDLRPKGFIIVNARKSAYRLIELPTPL